MGFLILALVLGALPMEIAWAQSPIPPDLIRLKSGGMLRGTIVELVPDKEVTFVGVDGQTRKLPMSDVAFAGPSANDPQQAAPAPTPAPLQVPAFAAPVAPTLRLRSTQPDLTYFVKRGTSTGTGLGYAYGHGPVAVGVTADHYERLCTAPCEAHLDPGNWVLGIARGSDKVLAAPALNLLGNEELTATHVSRLGLRLGIWGAAAVLVVGGFIAAVRVDQAEQDCRAADVGSSCDYDARGWAALSVTGVGLLTALVPLLIHDRADITVRP